jgi:hypothetical protein
VTVTVTAISLCTINRVGVSLAFLCVCACFVTIVLFVFFFVFRFTYALSCIFYSFNCTICSFYTQLRLILLGYWVKEGVGLVVHFPLEDVAKINTP